MGLAQDIMVRSEFTYKDGGKGTRGSTPGNYILGYMARENAGEPVTPVRLMDADTYITRYMARQDAVDVAVDVDGVKRGIRDAQKYGGQAFGYGSLSLSQEGLVAAGKDVQRLFDEGKTVMKTVLSFRESYLKDNGIVDPSFRFERRGDYRGNVDQMRLRVAIAHGIDRMAAGYFDDLRYVGVIQVDTAHVHCHLAMVDAGVGHLNANGEQRGKIPAGRLSALRRGIDLSLDMDKGVQHMAADVYHDKRNAMCHVKRFTHAVMEHNGFPQFLLACLPADERMWRAGSNRREMRKPNALVREYVTEVLSQPGSGYPEALASIRGYVEARRIREGLGAEACRKLYQDGREGLVTDCMNGVYRVLRQVPRPERTVRTPMLDVMGKDYTGLAARVQNGADDMSEFGFRLRTYASRLDHHKGEARKYRAAVESYESTERPDPASRVLHDYFLFEEEYHSMLMCKYQYFLDFIPPADEYEDGFRDLMDYRSRMRRLEAMRRDDTMLRMEPANAERYGIQVYGQRGGGLVRTNPEVLEVRQLRMEESYGKREADYRRMLAEYGLTLKEGDGRLRVSTEKPYSFDEVKALDIHHMGYDFPYDMPVSQVNAERFCGTYDRRLALYEAACGYLNATGQGDAVASLPGKDIRLMGRMADRLRVSAVLPRQDAEGIGAVRRSRTVPIDRDITDDMRFAVESAVQTVQELEFGPGRG